jgi:hypothetical protein|tara:strand:- start:475 stop:861 length:387 start_codon:yes stop_codon:yes gene_type:complete
MAKKLTRSKLVKKLDSVFSQYIRQKNAVNDTATCFTCGKKDHWKKLQNGHFQSRRHYSTRWDTVNCQVQCAGCNVFRFGEQFIFGQNLDNKFGEGTARRLHIKAQQTAKFLDFELIEMINKYNSLVVK